MAQTIEDSAQCLWQMARDLAQAGTAGTALNSQRAVRMIQSMLEAHAAQHAEASMITAALVDRHETAKKLSAALAEIKHLKGSEKQRAAGKMSAPVFHESQENDDE